MGSKTLTNSILISFS